MAPIITPVSSIVAGKINIKLHVRVINLWTVPDFSRPTEDNFIHLLLIDEKVNYDEKFISTIEIRIKINLGM